MPFNDWFGASADRYAESRPHYPDALFEQLARAAPRGLVWDCACGNGQASVALAGHFPAVVATDASDRQIGAAPTAQRVTFRVAPATASGLEDESCALVTVAQALHWFAGPAFYDEAMRVLEPGGVLAAWSYGLVSVNPAVDKAIRHLFGTVLGEYWPAERRHVDNGYADFVLPGAPVHIAVPAMQGRWHVEQMLAYLATWSALERHRQATGSDALATVAARIRAGWPAGEARVAWPLVVLAAQKV